MCKVHKVSFAPKIDEKADRQLAWGPVNRIQHPTSNCNQQPCTTTLNRGYCRPMLGIRGRPQSIDFVQHTISMIGVWSAHVLLLLWVTTRVPTRT